MANHCFEVRCPECGAGWCERGCGWSAGPVEDWKNSEAYKEYEGKKLYGDNETRQNRSGIYVYPVSCRHCRSNQGRYWFW